MENESSLMSGLEAKIKLKVTYFKVPYLTYPSPHKVP